MTIVFLQYLIILIPLAVCFGIFGSFALWEGNSFFSHSLSHSAVLPTSICIYLNIINNDLIMLINFCFGLLFVFLYFKIGKFRHGYFSNDSLLNIVSSFFIGASLIIIFLSGNQRDLLSFIIGDILLIDSKHLFLLYVIAVFSVVFILRFDSLMIIRIFSKEVAILEERRLEMLNLFFIVIQSFFILLTIRMTGLLLISSAFIMPSFASRMISGNPREMIFKSILISFLVMVVAGFISDLIDFQFVPLSIVLYSAVILIILIFSKRKR